MCAASPAIVRCMGRGGRSGGNLFDGGLGGDNLSLEDLIPGITSGGRQRQSRPRSRPVTTFGVRATQHAAARPPRRARRAKPFAKPRIKLLIFRVVVMLAVFLLGAVLAIAGAVTSIHDYSAAGAMASAPACPAGTDLINSTADCVGNAVLGAQDGADSTGQEDELTFGVSEDDGYYLFVDYPANADFDAVLGDDDSYPVRVEFWQGQAVALTAARDGDVQTVTTDQNPNNKAGSDLGVGLIGAALADLALLLLMSVRLFRERWLRPGLVLRLAVSAMIVSCIGLFVAAGCMMTQPARVALTMTIAPSVTAGVILVTWFFVVFSTWQTGYLIRARGAGLSSR